MNQSSNITRAWYKKPAFYIIGSVLIAVVISIAFNFERARIFYSYAFECSHFNPGQPVYIKHYPTTGDSYEGVIICRLIKPLRSEEIDTMSVSDVDKAKLRLFIKDNNLYEHIIQTKNLIIEYKKIARLVNI